MTCIDGVVIMVVVTVGGELWCWRKRYEEWC